MISAKIVADSLSPQGDRLTSLLITFPRFILAEINTHRMLSKNTSSSRAIPFNKMVEAVQNNPFIPIAWQRHHSGMQGFEYITSIDEIEPRNNDWLDARNDAIKRATYLHEMGVTKQLCNRLLEPFMWTTMLITGSKEGWDNFFNLRCPKYYYDLEDKHFKSKKEWLEYYKINCIGDPEDGFELSELEWLQINQGQAEIHIMDLAEKIYDAMNESTPKQLNPGEWHIPFEDKIDLISWLDIVNDDGHLDGDLDEQDRLFIIDKVKISTAMAARTSYTVVGDEKEVDYQKMIDLHNRLIEMRHDSPLEHCARAMSDEEYYQFRKGKVISLDRTFIANNEKIDEDIDSQGWCRNFKGFLSYRSILEDEK